MINMSTENQKENQIATGAQELKVLVQGLCGEHIPLDKNQTMPFPTEHRVAEIDCCDVIAGDCNTDSCV